MEYERETEHKIVEKKEEKRLCKNCKSSNVKILDFKKADGKISSHIVCSQCNFRELLKK